MEHDTIYFVEQNRDAQMAAIIKDENPEIGSEDCQHTRLQRFTHNAEVDCRSDLRCGTISRIKNSPNVRIESWQKQNLIGLNLTEKDYDGAPSTMCKGCGHDAISASVQRAYFESSIDPRKVVKLSGIGCSSKTPAYFLSQSFGFNAVHGRMSAVATGANLANHSLMPIGVSGDGDTSAIGLGNFCHMMRRNVNITYIIENNGVYGLTKGQFSATADVGSVMKGGKGQRHSSHRLGRVGNHAWSHLCRPQFFRRSQTAHSA